MRLLDVFSGAGGSAVGYHRAGFTDITGVDNRPMPRYPFRFVQADALEFLAGVRPGEYALIHCSPPCQHYSRATAWRGDRRNHPDLIAAVRRLLEATATPYVIENVEDARRRLRNPVRLCGSLFGLPVRRHRYFEAPTLPPVLLPACQHRPQDYAHDHGGKQTESAYRNAMGCEWMTVREAREAIPPAYCMWIGRQLLRAAT